ncbi:MAG: MOSC domain-containing protein [Alphaproteobacteria bacterium]|nr:MOSC domain-containing protein [Alphaproteobacteria bacterium]
MSLINLATVRSLEEQWGFEIDPLRFRANIYIDGGKPWEEFDWIGHDIAIGPTVFRVDRRNGRCGATNVNPGSGRRDLDIPGSLRTAFGHKDLGVYLVTRKTGEVSVGTGPRAAVRPARPCDAGAALHLPWLLLHLRGAIRPAAAGRAARNGLRRAPRLLSVPRLRH